MAAVWRLTRTSLVSRTLRSTLGQAPVLCGSQAQTAAFQPRHGAKTWVQGSPELQALIHWNSINKKLFGPVIKRQEGKGGKAKKKTKKKKNEEPTTPKLLYEQFVTGVEANAVDIVEVGQSEQEVFRSLPHDQKADDADISDVNTFVFPTRNYRYTLSSADDPYSESSESEAEIPAIVPPPFMPGDAVLRSEARSKIAGYNPVTPIPTPKFKPPTPPPAPPQAPRRVSTTAKKTAGFGSSVPLPEIPVLDVILDLPLFPDESSEEWKEKLEPYVEFVSSLDARTPTVNQVLSKTQSELSRFFLLRWRERMIAEHGEEGFKVIQEETLRNGILLHHLIQQYLGGTMVDEAQVQEQNEGHWHSVRPVFSRVTEVKALETPVSHPQLLYRGTLDCVAAYRGHQCVIDWKTSKKPKPALANTYDNPLQVVAYLGAVNSGCLPGVSSVEGGAIVVVYPDGSPAHVHTLDRLQCQQQWQQWLQRLKQYWQTLALEKGVVASSASVKSQSV